MSPWRAMATPFVPKMTHFYVLGKPDMCCVDTIHVLCGHHTCAVWTPHMCCVDTTHVLCGNHTCALWEPHMCFVGTTHVLCGHHTMCCVDTTQCAVWTPHNVLCGHHTLSNTHYPIHIIQYTLCEHTWPHRAQGPGPWALDNLLG